jgi:hypothetical protein
MVSQPRGNRFRRAQAEAMSSETGTHDVKLTPTEPMTSGPPCSAWTRPGGATAGGGVLVAVVVRRAAGTELALDAAGGRLWRGLQLAIEGHPRAFDDQSVAVGPHVADLAGRAVLQLGTEGAEDACSAEIGCDPGAVESVVTQVGRRLDHDRAPAPGQQHDVPVRVASARRERHLDLAAAVGETGGVGRESVRRRLGPAPAAAARARQRKGRDCHSRADMTTTAAIDHDSAR